MSWEPQYRSTLGTLGYLEKFFKGYAFMQICSKLPIEKMFALYFFVRALIVLIQLVDKFVHCRYE